MKNEKLIIKNENAMKMKRLFSFFLFPSLIGLAFLLASCEYEEIAPLNYPEGKIYLPAAYSGIVYTIDDITQPTLATPTPGSSYRYKISDDNTQFIIPLAIYRSGLEPGGRATVNIHESPDIVSSLIADKTLENEVQVLPAGKYSLEKTSVELTTGQVLSPFELMVDFDFLHQQAIADNREKEHAQTINPDTIYASLKYALGITISSEDQECNPDLSTVVVLIDTRILLPEPFFTLTIDEKEVTFDNKSKFAVTGSCLWDFGDGTEISAEQNPVHIYPALTGIINYTVTLTATGVITGEKRTFSRIVSIR
jgi:hypothetical protein